MSEVLFFLKNKQKNFCKWRDSKTLNVEA